jgi:hypothetical protein
VLLGKGEIDSQTALELSTLTKNWIDAKYAREELQLKLINSGQGEREQKITVTGGLPPLPGCNVIGMNGESSITNGRVTVLNGHGPIIEHQAQQTQIESTESKDAS